MDKNKIYFAHPVNIYDQPLEAAMVQLIAHCLTDGDLDAIENPNQPHHQKGYDAGAARARQSSTQHQGMKYFFDEVLPGCSGCVAMPFLDGRMGLGVAGEAKRFLQAVKPVWMVEPTHMPTPADLIDFIEHPLDSTLFRIRPLTPEEESLLLPEEQDPQLVVPHQETRLRTWLVYNQGEKRPYEEAHLVTMPIPEGFYPAESS